MAWVSLELNETTNRLELWDIEGSVMGEIVHGQSVVVVTGGEPLSATMVQHNNHWKIQTRDMKMYDFPQRPGGLIVQQPSLSTTL